MLSAKSQGVFIEFNQFSILASHTSALTPPFTVNALKEFPVGVPIETIQEQISQWTGSKRNSTSTFARAHCGFYPTSRFVRRHTVDQPAKLKDPNFFVDILTNQYRIDTDKNLIAIINATDGSSFTADKNLANQKELVLCGALSEEFQQAQNQIVEATLFPESLQLGCLSLIGGLMDYAEWSQFSMPTMILEVSPEISHLYIFNSEKLDISRPIPYGLNAMFPLIQQELGLKDEDSAKKLFYSNTFDFTEMGPVLLRKMLKELQASTGFYEVQTGQTIGQIYLSLLPKNLNWIAQVISKSLGVKVLTPDYKGWLQHCGITLADSIQMETLDARWLGLFSLMGKFNAQATAAENAEKKN